MEHAIQLFKQLEALTENFWFSSIYPDYFAIVLSFVDAALQISCKNPKGSFLFAKMSLKIARLLYQFTVEYFLKLINYAAARLIRGR